MSIDHFQKTIETGVGLLDFKAPWCAPCRAQEPMMKELARRYEGRVEIIEINIDEHRSLATQYRVQSIPCLIVFKSGQEIKRFVGLQSEAVIAQSLDQAIEQVSSYSN